MRLYIPEKGRDRMSIIVDGGKIVYKVYPLEKDEKIFRVYNLLDYEIIKGIDYTKDGFRILLLKDNYIMFAFMREYARYIIKIKYDSLLIGEGELYKEWWEFIDNQNKRYIIDKENPIYEIREEQIIQ